MKSQRQAQKAMCSLNIATLLCATGVLAQAGYADGLEPRPAVPAQGATSAQPAAAKEVTPAGKATSTSTANDGSGTQGYGLNVALAYRRMMSIRRDSSYINVSFQGQTLVNKGTELTDATGYDTFKAIRNDTPSIQFNIAQAPTNVTGVLASLLKVTTIPGNALGKNIRGVVQGYGTLDNTASLGIAAGLESTPISFKLPEVPTYLILGVQGGTQPKTATSASTGVGVLAYRCYIAYAPLNAYSDDRKAILNYLKTDNGEKLLVLQPNIIKLSEFDAKIDSSLSPVAQKWLTSFLSKWGDLAWVPNSIGTDASSIITSIQSHGAAFWQNWPLSHPSSIPPDKLPEYLRGFIGNFGCVGVSKMKDSSAEKVKNFISEFHLDTPTQNSIEELVGKAYASTSAADKQQLLKYASLRIIQAIAPAFKPGNLAIAECAFAQHDRSSFVLSIEPTGQYYLAGDSVNGRDRLNALIAATATYYFNPGAANRTSLRLRYENGRDRAAPKTYLNQLTLGMALEF